MKKLIVTLICCLLLCTQGHAISIDAFACADQNIPDCKNAFNTVQINKCLTAMSNAAEKEMGVYLTESLKNLNQDQITTLNLNQNAWLTYRDNYCGLILDYWSDGTVSTGEYLNCSYRLTKQRTQLLWQDFLTYIDSTPARLPEPVQCEVSF